MTSGIRFELKFNGQGKQVFNVVYTKKTWESLQEKLEKLELKNSDDPELKANEYIAIVAGWMMAQGMTKEGRSNTFDWNSLEKTFIDSLKQEIE